MKGVSAPPSSHLCEFISLCLHLEKNLESDEEISAEEGAIKSADDNMFKI